MNSPVTAGTGPRSIAFTRELSPGVLFAAVANTSSSNIRVYSVNTGDGTFTLIQTVPIILDSPSSIVYTQNTTGNLYAIVGTGINGRVRVYSVDTGTGLFGASTFVDIGGAVGSVAVTPEFSGQYFVVAADPDTNNVVSLTLSTTGTLAIVSTETAGTSPGSVALTQNTVGNVFAAVANVGSDNVSVFLVDTTTGAFTPVNTFSTGSGSNPNGISFTRELSGQLYAATANFGNNTISLFNVNTTTGIFTQNSGPFSTGVNTQPAAIAFTQNTTGNVFAGVSNSNTDNVGVFQLVSLLATPSLDEVSSDCNGNIRVQGTGVDPSSTIKVFADGNQIGSGPAGGANFDVTVPTVLTNGTYTITVTQTSTTNCSSLPSAGLPVEINVAAKPNLLDAAADCDSALTVIGNGAQSGATISVFVDGNLLPETAFAEPDGSFNFSQNTNLSGSHSITVTQTITGNPTCESVPSDPKIVSFNKVDAPNLASAIIDCTGNLTVSGSGVQVGATITVFANGVQQGSSISTDGNFNFSVATSLAGGTYQIRVTQSNSQCTSEESNPRNIDVATKIPPTLSSASVDCAGDELNVTGSGAEPDASITVFADSVNVGNSNADGSGNFDFTMILNPALSVGTHSITVTQTNLGCETGPSNAFEVSVIGCEFRITSPPTNTTTTDRTPTIIGIGPANSNIIIFDIFPSNTIMLTKKIEKSFATNIVGETTSDSAGNFSFTPTTPLAFGTHTIFAALASDTNVRSNRVVITIVSSGVLGDSLTQAIFNKYGCSL